MSRRNCHKHDPAPLSLCNWNTTISRYSLQNCGQREPEKGRLDGVAVLRQAHGGGGGAVTEPTPSAAWTKLSLTQNDLLVHPLLCKSGGRRGADMQQTPSTPPPTYKHWPFCQPRSELRLHCQNSRGKTVTAKTQSSMDMGIARAEEADDAILRWRVSTGVQRVTAVDCTLKALKTRR